MPAAESVGRERVPSPSLLVARVVWLEIRRREEFLALFILMGLYLLFALGARLVGNTQTEAVALMVNMGLWISSALSAVLTLVTTVRLIPSEIEARTLYPLLAKPVERGEVILGKFLATTAAGWLCLFVFTLLTTLTWAAKFPLPGQDGIMFVQAFLLQGLALALLCGFSLFLSLVVPRSVAILVGGLLYFGGGSLLNILRGAATNTALKEALDWCFYYLPDFSKLCLLQRFTDGAPSLPWGEWISLAAYSILCSLFFLMAATKLFERRAI
jgi:ABC-type transport system involved in multi-copper enzyme maturation permease subunit